MGWWLTAGKNQVYRMGVQEAKRRLTGWASLRLAGGRKGSEMSPERCNWRNVGGTRPLLKAKQA